MTKSTFYIATSEDANGTKQTWVAWFDRQNQVVLKEDPRDVDTIVGNAIEKGFDAYYCSNHSSVPWWIVEKIIKSISTRLNIGFYEGEIELCSRIVKYQED